MNRAVGKSSYAGSAKRDCFLSMVSLGHVPRCVRCTSLGEHMKCPPRRAYEMSARIIPSLCCVTLLYMYAL